MTARSVLITGAFGSGKSAVVGEIAEMLEANDVRYGALDLDWLWWFNGGDEAGVGTRLLLQNLEAVVGNYTAVGVDRFVMALAVETEELADSIAIVVPGPQRVVRLETPIEVIAGRLTNDAGSGRDDDLRRAEQWIGQATGVGFEDFTATNDRPIGETAAEILAWLGW